MWIGLLLLFVLSPALAIMGAIMAPIWVPFVVYETFFQTFED
jgi:hypothetical protein